MKLSRTVLFMMATAAATFSYADDAIPADASAAATTIEATSPTDEIMTPISFIANGGEGTMEILYLTEEAPEQALTLCAYTREGYTFYGWALSADGDVVYADGATVKFEEATDLYARWAKNEYTVKFNKNGGKGKMKAQKQNFTKPSKLTKNAFTKKGYVFVGWALEKKGAVVYKNQASVAIPTDGEVTLYARYAKKNYKVKFYANGGKGKTYTQKMTYGKSAKLVANKFKASEGFTFKGWARTKADAAAGKVAFKNKKSVKNVLKTGTTAKLYAVWAPIAE